MCRSMVDIQSVAAEIRQGKKRKKEERRTNHSMKIYMVSLLHRATIKYKLSKMESQMCCNQRITKSKKESCTQFSSLIQFAKKYAVYVHFTIKF